jgi:hypothetical protein
MAADNLFITGGIDPEAAPSAKELEKLLENSNNPAMLTEKGQDILDSLNKVNPTFANEFVVELATMLSKSGQPTAALVASLKNETIEKQMAKIKELFLNEPTAAKQGPFLVQILKAAARVREKSLNDIYRQRKKHLETLKKRVRSQPLYKDNPEMWNVFDEISETALMHGAIDYNPVDVPVPEALAVDPSTIDLPAGFIPFDPEEK